MTIDVPDLPPDGPDVMDIIDTLDQAEYWVDKHGKEHQLDNMLRGYKRNVLAMLERDQEYLYHISCLLRPYMLVDPINPDPDDFDWPTPTVEQWFESRPLIRRLRREA